MNCERFRDRIHERLRGKLPGAECDDIDRHAEGCPDCNEYLATCSELTCREFVEFLHAYIDRDLPEDRVAVFDGHLSVCPDCTAYVHSYRKTMDLGVAAMSELAAEEIPDDLVRAILAARDSD